MSGSTKKYAVLTIPQRQTIAYSRCVSGSISVISSAIIVRKVLCRADRTPYHRLLLGISLVDIGFSFWAALATLPVPASTGVVGGHGNTASCAAAAFFMQWGVIIPLYMASLSTYFLLRIRLSVSDADVQKKYEIFLHGIPILFGTASCILGLALEVFNPIGLPELGCWLAAYPIGCEATPESAPCERGRLMATHHNFLVWGFSHAWMFAGFFVTISNNIAINKGIRDQGKKNARYQTPSVNQDEPVASTTVEPSAMRSLRNLMPATRQTGSNSSLNSNAGKKERAAAIQSMLYVCAAFMSPLWQFLLWLGYHLQAEPAVRYFLALFFQIFFPIQGVFNLLIYIRPRYMRHRREQPDVSRFKLLIRSICEAP